MNESEYQRVSEKESQRDGDSRVRDSESES